MKESRNKPLVVYTSMVGDLFHIGHARLLERASKLGDILIVGVIDDEHVYEYKNKHPVFTLKERMEIISSIKYVHQVIPQFRRDGSDNIRKLSSVDIVVRGDDAILYEEKRTIEEMGGSYVVLPRTPAISTTEIIEKIKSNG